jgi:hypothetical protein
MSWPKPVQKPHPPVIVGGAFPYSARRVLRYGDGWLPHRSRPAYADIIDLLPEFRRMAVAEGRDPDNIPISVWGGTEDLDLLKRDRDAGVARVVITIEPGTAEALLPELDRWAALIRGLDG